MKPRPGPEMFNESLLDRASAILSTIKKDTQDMRERLEDRQVSMKDTCAALHAAQDALFNAGQLDLFQQHSNTDFDEGIFTELVEIIGRDAANRLVDYYSGSSIYIPKSIIVEQMHRKIREEYKSGAIYRDLAVQYGYSERHVRNIIHKKE
jgi:hypothetical protein